MDDDKHVPGVYERHEDYMVLEAVQRRHEEGFDFVDLRFRTLDDHETLRVKGDNIPLALSMPMGKRLYVHYSLLDSGLADGWYFDRIDRFVVCGQMSGPCPEHIADVWERRTRRDVQ